MTGRFCFVLLCSTLFAQDAERFEVASVRPSSEKGDRPSFEISPGGRIHAANVTLQLLIQTAYDIRPEQLSGGPAWTASEEYTLDAKGPEGAAPMDLTRQRLQSLLRDRFHLELQVESDPSAGYALTVEKQGHHMTPALPGTARLLRQVGRWEVRAEAVEMAILARFLSVHLHAAVVDRTGLDGRFNFRFSWNPGVRNGESLDAADERAAEALARAVPEQLGLRLTRQKVPADRYTIRHAEKPMDN